MYPTGPFSVELTDSPGESYGFQGKSPRYLFNANSANQLYGASLTIQPSSARALLIIKF